MPPESKSHTIWRLCSMGKAYSKHGGKVLLDQQASINFVVVSPGPPHLEPTISAHVLLIQHPLPECLPRLLPSMILLLTRDNLLGLLQPYRTSLLSRISLLQRPTTEIAKLRAHRCFLRLERHAIPPGHRVRISDGHNIIMQVCRANLPANWCPPIQPEEPGTEGAWAVATFSSTLGPS